MADRGVDARLHVRITNEQRQGWQREAQRLGLSMSEWLRDLADERIADTTIARETTSSYVARSENQFISADELARAVLSRREGLTQAAGAEDVDVPTYLAEVLDVAILRSLADRRHFQLEQPAWDQFLGMLDETGERNESLAELLAETPSDKLTKRLRA